MEEDEEELADAEIPVDSTVEEEKEHDLIQSEAERVALFVAEVMFFPHSFCQSF